MWKGSGLKAGGTVTGQGMEIISRIYSCVLDLLRELLKRMGLGTYTAVGDEAGH